MENMTETDSPATAQVTAQLEALAADLDRRGFAATVLMGGRNPHVTVVNKAAPQLSETVSAAPTGDASWWFWWSWAERISPVTEVAAAGQAIAWVLRAVDGGQ